MDPGLPHIGLISGLYILFELGPDGPLRLVRLQHEFEHRAELAAVNLAELVQVVVDGVPVDLGVLFPVALILVGEEAGLEHHHAESEHVALVGVGALGLDLLLGECLALLGGEVDVRGAVLRHQGLVVGLLVCRQRVRHLDDALLRQQDGIRTQTLVLDACLLEVAQSEDAAGQDRPQLLLLELPVVLLPFGDLVAQGLVGIVVQSVQLVKAGAVVVLAGLKVLCVGSMAYIVGQQHAARPRGPSFALKSVSGPD